MLYTSLQAKEGMWLPHLLAELNEEEMREMGLQLTAEDIYSINQSSLKDGIVSFGGFCTGEVISSKGLVLTNHHCGYRQIQSHSSVENDLLKNGFWAMSTNDELANPGLFVTFIKEIHDVTEEMLANLPADLSEVERERLISERAKNLVADRTHGNSYDGFVRSIYEGNEYLLFLTQRYSDIRLVGAPPSSIGKFGGDTDNWMWPRHTGDFAIFRIYADKNGDPAPYSEDNVPYEPEFHFKLNIGGVKDGDFTMVYGFPGRTEQYLSSWAVEELVETTNPHRIAIRDRKLDIINERMRSSDEIRIKYAGKQAGTANAWKKWQGENKGLYRLNAINKKQQLEADFLAWLDQHPTKKEKYGEVLPRLKKMQKDAAKANFVNIYINEAIYGSDIMKLSRSIKSILQSEGSHEEVADLKGRVNAYLPSYFKDYDTETDRQIFVALSKQYINNVPEEFLPTTFSQVKNSKKGVDAALHDLFDKSALADQEFLNRFTSSSTKDDLKRLKKDPILVLGDEIIRIYEREVSPKIQTFNQERSEAYRLWVAGLREMQTDKRFFPDANSTLRLTYGMVESSKPKDGVQYLTTTHLSGVMTKEDPTNDEFVVPKRLRELYEAKDFGPYGDDDLAVCFISSNHTTGGNSGSPVINAKGELIGTNFDRNWEGTMSDIMFDPDQCRNIAIDIRYTLFIVDKFAGASHLLDEMTIVTERP